MITSSVLALHIVSGTLGFLSGAAALSLRKGSRWHGLTGRVFVVTMLSLAVTGIALAIVKSQPGNILGGSLTAYLILTAWLTARRRSSHISFVDWTALFIASALAATAVTLGIEAARSPAGMIYHYPPGPYFFLGSIASLSALGDARLLIKRTLSQTQRLARHLWRMCFALFIASASIFLARQNLFPTFMRRSGTLYVLTLFPLLLMVFWLFRIRFASVYREGSAHADEDTFSAEVS